VPRRRRTTRLEARLEQRAGEAAARTDRETHDRQQRAMEQTPLEQALSVVIAGGFLYRYDCMEIAAARKSCNDIWYEEKETFPEWANVQVIQCISTKGVGIFRQG
jgi:hypothetical protein